MFIKLMFGGLLLCLFAMVYAMFVDNDEAILSLAIITIVVNYCHFMLTIGGDKK